MNPTPFVEVHETHSGVVVLYGDCAYKTKKPVSTPFLDFTSRAQRDAACIREIALNRRLAPDVYLGLGHLRSPDRDPEPIVVMRRLAEETKLSHRLDSGDSASDAVSAVARMVARFHQAAERNEVISGYGTPAALRTRWEDNLVELEEFCQSHGDAAVLHQITLLAHEYIDGRGVLLTDRVRAGRIIDGHGDLLTDDIFCLPDGPRILDCLDFDDRLRYLDGVDDAAFLAMDIEFHGHRSVAEEFIVAYTDAAEDNPPPSLVDHYIAYRAVVRAKVDFIRAGQGVGSAYDDAHRHLQLAHEHLVRGRVRLGIVGGLPGTGKTTLATRLSGAAGAVLISSDVVRAELVATGVITGAAGDYGEGLYSAANKAVVYRSMLERARAHLQGGRPVVLDGSWMDSEEREVVAALAAETSSALVMLRCVVDEDVAHQRIIGRVGDASEATPAIAHSMAESERGDPWQTAATVDTSASVDDSADAALRLWNTAAIPLVSR